MCGEKFGFILCDKLALSVERDGQYGGRAGQAASLLHKAQIVAGPLHSIL